MKKLIITIDGPCASGKSTTGKLLASKLDYTYVDTGALYRAIGLEALKQGINTKNENDVIQLLNSISLGFCLKNGQSHVTINGKDVEQEIRTEKIGKAASDISAHEKVRDILLKIQRDIGKNGGIIMDGRDIGTVIFPNADIKFFLFATPEIRGKRRWLELKSKGYNISQQDVLKQIIERDKNDSTRKVAPLKKPKDAIPIDSSHMSIKEVVHCMIKHINKRLSYL